MWHFISEQISEQLGQDFICDDTRQINGASHTQNFRISDGRLRFFVKVAEQSALPRLETEAEGLDHLRQAEGFIVPKVICLGTVSQHSFLVLEYLHLQEGSTDNWLEFGRCLARFHGLQQQEMYGWQSDNYIATTLQPNGWQKKWCQFFAEQRIGYQLQLLAEKQLLKVKIDQVVESIRQLLAGYLPPVSPLHGDLWQGNAGFCRHRPVIFDPAFYYGDRETDLAMTELFGRFPQAFYDGYEEIWPLEEGYQYRRPVYQLYHTLNHALLFGGQYLQSAKSQLQNLEG
ncbi:fructosamine kinase family protein [Aliiglaciecola sp. CAU 1673]|uniref:fructosamine kinase family protein n=1 Tax=Aliiglaciecola sp. CAU 1673 TaxID=3032595 RepID=UPI0023DB12DD|nr:fructosamine kinase family protein [Aliiglaciecola sp. CAU 1673]MDF2177601.1 fructosamine kinase family protein [Aliiglaciecola sp. CAU 1673]